MVGAVDGEFLLGHSVAGSVRHSNLIDRNRPLFPTILVKEAAILFFDGFEIFIDRIHSARCVHPASAIVEALVDEKLAPGRRAVSIQTLLAYHLQLRPEKERNV